MAQSRTPSSGRRVPIKSACLLAGLILLYAVCQPLLNGRLGWQLPSLASLSNERAVNPDGADRAGRDSSTNASEPATRSPTSTVEEADHSQPARERSPRTDLRPSDPLEALAGQTFLHSVGERRYVSPAGLRYAPGSAEGHRLSHLQRHLQDMPDRPGKHGVFTSNLAQVLVWIDEAYERGKQGSQGVRKVLEQNRTVYEVPFDEAIGYVGGREGRRIGNPSARRLRLVVEDSHFVTAFPF